MVRVVVCSRSQGQGGQRYEGCAGKSCTGGESRSHTRQARIPRIANTKHTNHARTTHTEQTHTAHVQASTSAGVCRATVDVDHAACAMCVARSCSAAMRVVCCFVLCSAAEAQVSLEKERAEAYKRASASDRAGTQQEHTCGMPQTHATHTRSGAAHKHRRGADTRWTHVMCLLRVLAHVCSCSLSRVRQLWTMPQVSDVSTRHRKAWHGMGWDGMGRRCANGTGGAEIEEYARQSGSRVCLAGCCLAARMHVARRMQLGMWFMPHHVFMSSALETAKKEAVVRAGTHALLCWMCVPRVCAVSVSVSVRSCACVC